MYERHNHKQRTKTRMSYPLFLIFIRLYLAQRKIYQILNYLLIYLFFVVVKISQEKSFYRRLAIL